MLKPSRCIQNLLSSLQPPSGGCVLKHPLVQIFHHPLVQPPSGGCVLKRIDEKFNLGYADAAAFGRLCVETAYFLRVKVLPVRSRLRAAVC